MVVGVVVSVVVDEDNTDCVVEVDDVAGRDTRRTVVVAVAVVVVVTAAERWPFHRYVVVVGDRSSTASS